MPSARCYSKIGWDVYLVVDVVMFLFGILSYTHNNRVSLSSTSSYTQFIPSSAPRPVPEASLSRYKGLDAEMKFHAGILFDYLPRLLGTSHSMTIQPLLMWVSIMVCRPQQSLMRTYLGSSEYLEMTAFPFLTWVVAYFWYLGFSRIWDHIILQYNISEKGYAATPEEAFVFV